MIRLKESEALKQKIRQDDMPDLAIPTWTLVREAIQAGRIDEAIEFLEYGCDENESMHDSIIAFVDDTLTHLASLGEEEIPKLLRKRYSNRIKKWLSATPGAVETVQRFAEGQRGHHSNFTIVEEPDRYVISYDPCGSGGRLRRSRSVATTKKAYPWSWGKSGVPYYCTHCCVAFEIIPTELRGYPLGIHLIAEKPEDPCVQLIYKKPELIPEEYFTRIGMTKKIK